MFFNPRTSFELKLPYLFRVLIALSSTSYVGLGSELLLDSLSVGHPTLSDSPMMGQFFKDIMLSDAPPWCIMGRLQELQFI